jgi:hypothetical protein
MGLCLTLQISGGQDSSNEAVILVPDRWIWLLGHLEGLTID